MRKPIIVMAIAIALGAPLSTGAEPQSQGIARFRETEVSHHIALGHDTWRTRVLLRNKNMVVGSGVVACVLIEEISSIRECQGTYILPRGRLQVAGEIISRSGFQLSVIGGTGIYAGSQGLAIVTATSGTPRRANVTFFLT